MYCFLWWMFILSTVSCAVDFDKQPCRSQCVRTAMFTNYEKDYSLVRHVIARLSVQSPIDCMNHCIREPRCESFNCEYEDKPIIQCELNHATKNAKPDFYVERTGYNYHDALSAGDGWCKSICSSSFQSSVCPLGFSGLNCGFEMKSCQDWKNQGFHQDGVYFLSVATYDALPVYCDQTTDGGGWVEFQKRQDGTVDFYRNWQDYKTGFGSLSGEFWLGNDVIHILTSSQGLNELRVDLESFNGTKAFAKYSNFTILGESQDYKLLVSGYSGTAGDSLGTGIPEALRVHTGMSFSTFDRDNDRHEYDGSCAVEKHGAWWYNSCYWSHLNGKYKKYGDNTGIDWYSWSELNYHTLKKTEMKLR